MQTESPLLRPYRNGALALPNRVAMAPMTRGRADDTTGVPHPLTSLYYAQRASAGLIVTEGIWPSLTGKSTPGVPGIATAEQVDRWREVTTAVHAAGGRVFAQLWHAGRVSHPSLIGEQTVAPSAVRAEGRVYVKDGWTETTTPRALTTEDLARIVEEFVTAARNAIDAGFDGVELHGANGYLLHEFLADNTNLRTDRYGERIRFPLEVTEAVVAAIGADRVGYRISPGNPENDLVEADWPTVYGDLLDEFNRLGLAYLHVVATDEAVFPVVRPRWHGPLLGNLHLGPPSTREDAERLVEAGLVDVATFGRLFIGNPDLPARFATGAPLVEVDKHQHYGSALDGYVDFPAVTTTRLPSPVPA
ncbi:alkene reductase [Amycolatopsis sp. YIM 10]|uniref:alkene reductase n=1 Tax=Amycolatopsis sp. YIM 10 TaxID=2653857 RepID=UPI00129077CB|nr:alkene reductase [Amycolatopsis sp. YIM 10]QFU86215.1 N-ethylmaleimide reductase [Amycolatopsis sp. YIM 10]